jgi:hypothetical protein
MIGPPPAGSFPLFSRTDFFREEISKHRECLARQREYYSERAITCADAALARLMARVEQLSAREDAEQYLGGLLRKINVVTGLSYWIDPKMFH